MSFCDASGPALWPCIRWQRPNLLRPSNVGAFPKIVYCQLFRPLHQGVHAWPAAILLPVAVFRCLLVYCAFIVCEDSGLGRGFQGEGFCLGYKDLGHGLPPFTPDMFGAPLGGLGFTVSGIYSGWTLPTDWPQNRKRARRNTQNTWNLGLWGVSCTSKPLLRAIPSPTGRWVRLRRSPKKHSKPDINKSSRFCYKSHLLANL